jgi:hypothetical protein
MTGSGMSSSEGLTIKSGKAASKEKGGLTTGAIVGIVIGAIVVIALIVGGVYYYFYQSKAPKPKIRRDTNIDTNM